MSAPTLRNLRPVMEIFGELRHAVTRVLRSHNAAVTSVCVEEYGGVEGTYPRYGGWPNGTDVRYFDSEMRMAFICLQLATSAPADGKRNCLLRAVTIHTCMSEWVKKNGGHRALEQQLARLHWHLSSCPLVRDLLDEVSDRVDHNEQPATQAHSSDAGQRPVI